MNSRTIKTAPNRHQPSIFLALLFVLSALVLIPEQSLAVCPDGDYADELVLSNFALVSTTPLADDMQEVTISTDITNTDEAELSDVVATPDFSTSGLDVQVDGATPPQLGFATVTANQTKASSTNLQLQLPSANVNELLSQLNSGDIAFRITGG